jgi:transposase-like protein
MLVAALETEVAAYLEAHRDERDAEGHALVVRNGKGRTRKVTVGAGTIPVSVPRVNDRRTDCDGERRRFTSRILPPYNFPAEHWKHLRTSNVIESPFATVRLRQRVTKGAGSRTKALLMAYKLLDMAQARWRRLNGAHLLLLVRAGIVFVDGVQREGRASKTRARAA